MKKPHIKKQWAARYGVFYWTCDPIPQGNWGYYPDAYTVKLWDKAIRWCSEQNLKQNKANNTRLSTFTGKTNDF